SSSGSPRSSAAAGAGGRTSPRPAARIPATCRTRWRPSPRPSGPGSPGNLPEVLESPALHCPETNESLMRPVLGLAVAASLLCALPVCASSVSVKVREDGRRVIVNETRSQRATRMSATLVPVNNSLAALIEGYADNVGLDPRLVRAVIQVESGYNPMALSNKGAMGLMQLTADTAHDYAVDDPYDPDQNLRGGTAYLKALMDRFSGSLDLALASYNAGPGAVEKYNGIPPY